MNKLGSAAMGSVLRQRFVEDVAVHGFAEKTRSCYNSIVAGFAAFLGRSSDRAATEDISRFQVHQSELGMDTPAMNRTVVALRSSSRTRSTGRICPASSSACAIPASCRRC